VAALRDVAAQPGGETAAAAPLAPFDPLARVEWWWRQPRGFRAGWRLEAGGVAVAELSGEGLLSTKSAARLAGRELEIHRAWTGGIEVRETGSREALVRSEARWTGAHRVSGTNGDALALEPTGFWRQSHELRDADGHVLFRFESHDGLSRHETRVELEDAARRRADLPLLLLLAAAVAYTRTRHS
jgi:hypothetical protein